VSAEKVLALRILISGAGGFVGRHLAAATARAGHDVVALMHRTWPPALAKEPRVRLERADLAAADILPAGPFDALIHCAAAIPSVVPDDAELMRINVEAARRLFDHALRGGARIVIFCSSMAVYGRIEEEVVEVSTPVREPNAYGQSKLEGERFLNELSRAHPSLRALSLRLPGVVGLGSHDNFLSDTMARLLTGEEVIARNPDALFNNVVHIDDLARFTYDLLGTLPEGHRVVTIAADDPQPISDVVRIMEVAAARVGAVRYERAGRTFLISNVEAFALGYRPATVRDSVRRFAETRAAKHRISLAGAVRNA
jgi:UDP-glucose 4-epimerase